MMVVNWLDYPLKAQLDIPLCGVRFQFDCLHVHTLDGFTSCAHAQVIDNQTKLLILEE